MIDLHTHTTASDGQYSPEELAKKMKDLNVSVWAVTDHDTVSGLAEAKKAADECGITFVPGIELNIARPGAEFHLLGLGLYKITQSLVDIIEGLQNSRRERNLEIVRRMNADGINASLEDLTKEFPADSLGRPHIAKWLVENGVVKNTQAAFDKYLARGRPWYIERAGADFDAAAAAIYECGGLPVIAHPLSLYLSWGKLEPVLEDLKSRGLAGLEAYHPGARLTEGKRLESIARKLELIVTAGSDFHGEAVRRDRKPAHASGGMIIEDRFWTEELFPALSARNAGLA
ncbi:MAG: PHP domain-containing protein [Treponema sp.]